MQKMADQLLAMFAKFFNDERTSDVVIKVGSEQLYAHSVILINRSPYFKTMFETAGKSSATFDETFEPPLESGSGPSQRTTIVVHDSSFEVVSCLVEYLYTNDMSIDSTTTGARPKFDLKGLYICAEKYQVEPLRSEVEKKMIESLSATNVCSELFEYGHAFPGLRRRMLELFGREFASISSVAGWSDCFRGFNGDPEIFAEMMKAIWKSAIVAGGIGGAGGGAGDARAQIPVPAIQPATLPVAIKIPEPRPPPESRPPPEPRQPTGTVVVVPAAAVQPLQTSRSIDQRIAAIAAASSQDPYPQLRSPTDPLANTLAGIRIGELSRRPSQTAANALHREPRSPPPEGVPALNSSEPKPRSRSPPKPTPSSSVAAAVDPHALAQSPNPQQRKGSNPAVAPWSSDKPQPQWPAVPEMVTKKSKIAAAEALSRAAFPKGYIPSLAN